MTDDLVKRLNEDFSVNAREDIQHQMKVYEAERKEAADRIEQLQKNEKKYQDIISKLIAKKVADEYWEKILHSQSDVDPWSILKENE